MSDQIKLTNSKRRHEKRVYAPLTIADPQQDSGFDALGLAAFVRSLSITDSEESQLRQQLKRSGEQGALNAMHQLSKAVSAKGVLSAAASLAKVSPDDLQAVSKALGKIRKENIDKLTQSLNELDRIYSSENTPVASSTATTTSPNQIPAGTQPASVSHGLGTVLGDSIAKFNEKFSGMPSVRQRDVKMPATEKGTLAHDSQKSHLAMAMLSGNASPAGFNRIFQEAVGPGISQRASSLVNWAAQNKPEQLLPLLNTTQEYVTTTTEPAAQVAEAVTNLARLNLVTELFSASLTQMDLQPLGLLFLERLEMTPLGIERGELAYSLPLAPNEKVTLAHREWSVREDQFNEFIEDFQENFSEQGVAQTDDISQSTSTQSNHNNALSMSQPVAAANGVHVTSPVDASQSTSVDDTSTKEESKAQSRTLTALASTRTMKDHKISFTVTTVSGTEDFTAHLIENKFEDKSMRVDYFKRVRKWQSDLYRYGVRLTYDVVLPDPGLWLRAREVEIQRITFELSTEFKLDLLPSAITVYNWQALADQYGVSLPAPPAQVQQLEATQGLNYATPYDLNTASDGSKWHESQRLTQLNINIPPGYTLSNLVIDASFVTFFENGLPQGWMAVYYGAGVNSAAANPANHWVTLNFSVGPSQVPPEGQITVLFVTQFAASGLLKLLATVVPTDATMELWRLACWTIIRDGASARAAQHRSYLRERQNALQKQIAGDNPVTLRRMEKEAIMFSVLQWLFPGFQDATSVLASLPPPGYLDPGKWQQIMQYGEYIKFVQTAIDWDNVMVFLYPYFWDTVWHSIEKIFLTHPDPVHREFLRAGAARVVLAIQPGFEEQVVSLLNQGQLGNLPNQNRFAKAIDYVVAANKAFIETASGPEEVKEPGILIGSWTDYTPSSALDIQTTVIPNITSS